MKPLLAVVAAGVLLAGSTFLSAFQAQDSTQPTDSKPTRMTVTVTTSQGQPISDAFVELRLRGNSGKLVATPHQGTTNQHGSIAFQGLTSERYVTVLAAADGFATVIQGCQLVAGEHRKVRCKLGKPAAGWISVTAPDGTPLEGAEISELNVLDANGAPFFVNADNAKLLDPNLTSSNEEGRLMLPLLPNNAKVSLTVVHPKWASSRIENFTIANGKVGTATLVKGTTINANLVTSDGQPIAMGEKIPISVQVNGGTQWNEKKGTKLGQRLTHSIPADKGKIAFTVHDGQYRTLQATAEGYQITPVITPWYRGAGEHVGPALRFFGDPRSLNFVIRKKKPVTGTVTLDDGTPVEGVFVEAETENLIPESAGLDLTGLREWTTADVCETDKTGQYRLLTPAGKTRFRVSLADHYCDSNQEVFDIDPDREGRGPTILIKPMPVLKGIVRKSNGDPVPDCVIRDRDLDSTTGETHYFLTNNKGEFSFQIPRFSFDDQAKKISYVSKLIALDPASNEGATVKVNLRDADDFGHIEMTLEPKPADWLSRSNDVQPDDNNQLNGLLEKLGKQDFFEELEKKYPRGKPGNTVGELSQGTWLNTDATSLNDFRGKYILLDFWFIGCGPCERDLPNISLVQRLFADRDFTVVSVHITTQTVDNVRQWAKAKNMNYPLVVDNAEGEILKEFESMGVESFPHYLLLGPDGKILENDAFGGSPFKLSLRSDKLEIIHRYLNQANKPRQTNNR